MAGETLTSVDISNELALAEQLFDKIPVGQEYRFGAMLVRVYSNQKGDEKEDVLHITVTQEGNSNNIIFFRKEGASTHGRLYPASSNGTMHRHHWVALQELAASVRFQQVRLNDGENLSNPAVAFNWASEIITQALQKVDGQEVVQDLVALKSRIRQLEVEGKLTPDLIEQLNAVLDKANSSEA